jgi:hypothetical protein
MNLARFRCCGASVESRRPVFTSPRPLGLGFLRGLLGCAAFVCWASVSVELQAQAGKGIYTNAPLFEATAQVERAGTHVLGVRGHLKTERSQFSFIVPEGYRMVPQKGSKKVVFVGQDSSAMISVEVIEIGADAPQEPKMAALKDSVLATAPGAHVVEEFSLSAGGATGPAIEIEWDSAASSSMKMSRRVTQIMMGGSIVEFQRNCFVPKRTEVDTQFNSLLVTFRAAPAGAKQIIAPLSDKM